MRPVCSSAHRDRLGFSAQVRRACLSLMAAAPTGVGDPAGAVAGTPGAAAVDFGRDVLPILSDHCFRCHGPDARARKAGLRLDVKAGALRVEGPVIVPGRSLESEVIARVTSREADEVMPPPKAGRPLSPAQIRILTRWIDEGAIWATHWALTPPRRPPPPAVR